VHDSELNVTQSSNAVSNWGDQTANALAFIQATAAQKPVYTANAFGSRHSLHLTQTGVTTTTSCMSTATKKVFAAGLSYFVVAKWTSSDATMQGYAGDAPLTIISDKSGSIYNDWGASAGNIVYNQFIAGWNTQNRGSGLNDGVARLIGVTHVSATGVVTQYVGATAQGTTSTFTYQTTYNGYDSLGCGFNKNDGFDGDIGMVVTVAGVISAGDLTKLNRFCKAVWGTP
jgi:phage-related minor tail protein